MKSIFLSILFISLQGWVWFGSNNVGKLLLLKEAVAIQKTQNNQLRTQAIQLESKTKILQENTLRALDLKEDYIRFHLGYIKEKEWFYHW